MAVYCARSSAGFCIARIAVDIFSFACCTALLPMCEQTTYFSPLGQTFILNPKNSECLCFRLMTLDFSGLVSSPSRSFNHSLVASNAFSASCLLRQKILKQVDLRNLPSSLSEPYVNLSAHTAPIIQPLAVFQISSVQTGSCLALLSLQANVLPFV